MLTHNDCAICLTSEFNCLSDDRACCMRCTHPQRQLVDRLLQMRDDTRRVDVMARFIAFTFLAMCLVSFWVLVYFTLKAFA